MPVNDPVGDMLTRLRNASRAGHDKVVFPASKLKLEIAVEHLVDARDDLLAELLLALGRPDVVERLAGEERQQEVAHLGAKAVRVLELHDTTTSPGAVSGRTRVAVDGDDLVTATSQWGAEGETGRAGADDEHSHDG